MDDVIIDFVRHRMIHGAQRDAAEARRDRRHNRRHRACISFEAPLPHEPLP